MGSEMCIRDSSKGISVDTDGFDAAMARQKEQARSVKFKSADQGTDAIWTELLEKHGATKFTGYDNLNADESVIAIIQNGELVQTAKAGPVMFLTAKTPFYAESGGQAGDKGAALFKGGARIEISDVQKKAGELHVHIGELKGEISSGDVASLSVSADTVSYTHLTLPTILLV